MLSLNLDMFRWIFFSTDTNPHGGNSPLKKHQHLGEMFCDFFPSIEESQILVKVPFFGGICGPRTKEHTVF